MSSSITKAVIPVAGLGTRWLPITKVVPKELLPIGTKPALQLIVEEAVASGLTELIFVVSPHKSSLLDYFQRGSAYEKELLRTGKAQALEGLNRLLDQVKITSLIQEKPLGLGHAVWCAKKWVGELPFLVILPDDLYFYDREPPACRQLITQFGRTPCALNATEHAPRKWLSRYGVHTVAEQNGRLIRSGGVVEKPRPEEAPSDLIVIGRYLFTAEIFRELEEIRPTQGGEIQLAAAMNAMAKRGALYAYECEGKHIDIGELSGWWEANRYVCKRRDQKLR